MSPTQAADEIGFQEGSRWINKRPSGDDLASWFKDNVKLHDEMAAEDYVTGVVVIGAKEKLKEVRRAANDTTQIVDVERYTWTPYAKVETRVAYFWDLMLKHPDWLGIIEAQEVPRLETAGVYNLNLPVGFFRLPVALESGDFVHFVAASMRVRILDRSTVERVTRIHKVTDSEGQVVEEIEVQGYGGIPVMDFPPAVKMIAQLGRYGPDEFSLMKAETGAVGRALGMAGMLVIPGSGIATAEDMQEANAGARGEPAPEATLPAAGPQQAAQEAESAEEMAQAGIARLQSEAVDLYDELVAWAAEKKIDLMAPKDTQIRGLLLQVERKLAVMAERAT